VFQMRQFFLAYREKTRRRLDFHGRNRLSRHRLNFPLTRRSHSHGPTTFGC
jgi:hypothetical protein